MAAVLAYSYAKKEQKERTPTLRQCVSSLAIPFYRTFQAKLVPSLINTQPKLIGLKTDLARA